MCGEPPRAWLRPSKNARSKPTEVPDHVVHRQLRVQVGKERAPGDGRRSPTRSYREDSGKRSARIRHTEQSRARRSLFTRPSDTPSPSLHDGFFLDIDQSRREDVTPGPILRQTVVRRRGCIPHLPRMSFAGCCWPLCGHSPPDSPCWSAPLDMVPGGIPTPSAGTTDPSSSYTPLGSSVTARTPSDALPGSWWESASS